MCSNLVLNPSVHWYGFHTDHDFAYLLKILLGDDLPKTEDLFFKDLVLYFPSYYDVKMMAENVGNFTYRGSL
jgi:CCR4-NOT transcription complex subunit 7/8